MSSHPGPYAGPANRPTVAIVGTFDLSNFGDALFPLLAHWRLRDHIGRLLVLSPSDATPVWKDHLPTMTLEDFQQSGGECDLILLGGGDIVHLRPTPKGFYDDGWIGRYTTHGSLWAGSSLLAATRGCRVAWNAPGVPEPLDDSLAAFFSPEGNPIAYLSVRDEASRNHLPEAVRQHTAVVPDTLAEVSLMWPADESMSGDRQRIFLELTGAGPPPRYLTVHGNGFATPEDSPAVMAEAITACCRAFDAVPVFVCPGLCHQDPRWIDPVKNLLDPELQASSMIIESSMRDLTAVLAGAVAYVGSSLHGLIVSSSYGVPAFSVMPEQNPAHQKLRGHLDICGWSHPRLVSSWSEIAGVLPQAGSSAMEDVHKESADYLKNLQPALDKHWRRIMSLLPDPGATGLAETGCGPKPWLASLPLWAPACEPIGRGIAREFAGSLWTDASRFPQAREKLKLERQKTGKLRDKLAGLQADRTQLTTSWTWKLLRPLWRLERRLRGLKKS